MVFHKIKKGGSYWFSLVIYQLGIPQNQKKGIILRLFSPIMYEAAVGSTVDITLVGIHGIKLIAMVILYLIGASQPV